MAHEPPCKNKLNADPPHGADPRGLRSTASTVGKIAEWARKARGALTSMRRIEASER